MANTRIEPYLFFGGRCQEATEFYHNHLGAEIVMTMRYSESPEPHNNAHLPPNWDDKIMHTSFKIGDSLIMASDGMAKEDKHFHGFSLSLALPDEAACKRAFDALADGGEIRMPLTKTFWSPCFAMVTDRFGVMWMITIPGQP